MYTAFYVRIMILEDYDANNKKKQEHSESTYLCQGQTLPLLLHI